MRKFLSSFLYEALLWSQVPAIRAKITYVQQSKPPPTVQSLVTVLHSHETPPVQQDMKGLKNDATTHRLPCEAHNSKEKKSMLRLSALLIA